MVLVRGQLAHIISDHRVRDLAIQLRRDSDAVSSGEGSANLSEQNLGSLNAALAQWLMGAGLAPERYVAAQGTALGRAGRVFLERDADGTIWVGGDSVSCVQGQVTL